MTASSESLSIVCPDGVVLAATLFAPQEPVRAVVQLNMATAAKPSYYVPFARFLAEHGFWVCLWNYRGTGRHAGLRGCAYQFHDYGIHDMPAVLEYLDERFPSLPKLLVGHSVGGQQVGFMHNTHKISGLVTFATSVGYWGFMPLSYRLQTHFFFDLFSPISRWLCGYVAAGRFGIMEDLPSGVVRQWRAWCSRPAYFFDERFAGKSAPVERFQELTFPITAFWATDDPISNRRSVLEFWRHVRSTRRIQLVRLQPAALGVAKVGHFGFFRKHFRSTIWEQALSELIKFVSLQDGYRRLANT